MAISGYCNLNEWTIQCNGPSKCENVLAIVTGWQEQQTGWSVQGFGRRTKWKGVGSKVRATTGFTWGLWSIEVRGHLSSSKWRMDGCVFNQGVVWSDLSISMKGQLWCGKQSTRENWGRGDNSVAVMQSKVLVICYVRRFGGSEWLAVWVWHLVVAKISVYSLTSETIRKQQPGFILICTTSDGFSNWLSMIY